MHISFNFQHTEFHPLLEQEVKSLLDEGNIEQSSSQWASPAIMVPKPNGGIRLCIDYRKLNKITTPDVFPMLLIEDLVDCLAQSKVINSRFSQRILSSASTF